MKTILFLADGMRPDAITDIPEAKAMMKESTYTLKATTVMPSVTLPCHLSLFLSVDPERHGTTTNTYSPQVRPVDGLCEMLNKAGKKCAFFYNWEELRDLGRPGSLSYSECMSGYKEPWEHTTKILVDDAIRYINEYEPDFVFVYSGWSDETGHQYHWMSEEYMEVIKKTWKEIEKLTKSIPEDYNVIVTADHGGHGRSHGTDMPEDMLIPVICKGPDFEQNKEFENEINIKDIAPTIACLLDAEAAPEWEGTAFSD